MNFDPSEVNKVWKSLLLLTASDQLSDSELREAIEPLAEKAQEGDWETVLRAVEWLTENRHKVTKIKREGPGQFKVAMKRNFGAITREQQKTRIKETLLGMFRNPGMFGEESLTKGDMRAIAEAQFEKWKEVLPTSPRQWSAWFDELGFKDAKQSRWGEVSPGVRRWLEGKSR